jgi:hypothetical protein
MLSREKPGLHPIQVYEYAQAPGVKSCTAQIYYAAACLHHCCHRTSSVCLPFPPFSSSSSCTFNLVLHSGMPRSAVCLTFFWNDRSALDPSFLFLPQHRQAAAGLLTWHSLNCWLLDAGSDWTRGAHRNSQLSTGSTRDPTVIHSAISNLRHPPTGGPSPTAAYINPPPESSKHTKGQGQAEPSP